MLGCKLLCYNRKKEIMNERVNIEKDEKIILHQYDEESHRNKVISKVKIGLDLPR